MSSPAIDDRPIQIAEDLKFQFRMSRVQRVGKALLSLLVLAALAGLLGGGPLSRTTVRDTSGRVSVQFDRFARASDAQSLDLQFRRDTSGDKLEFWIDSKFLSGVELESISPEPDSQSASEEGIRVNLDVDPATTRALVTVRYRPLSPGWLSGRLGLGGSAATFRQFVYP